MSRLAVPTMKRLLAGVRAQIGVILLGAWFAVMVVLGAGLLARHVVALPVPAASPSLGAALSTLRTPENQSRWLAVHVLYAGCRCSQRIVEHLLVADRPPDWSERVLWVGSPAPNAALGKRFDVLRIDESKLARYGIESAPMLIAMDPDDRVRYAGGYTERKQGPVIDDVHILEAVRRSGLVASLPVFGCAVSDRLKHAFQSLPVP